ncbi:MAG TPA: DNA primase [Anaerolineae bacterium]|nr:DNA primase [Anaerolineae bacterium]
MSVIDDIKDRIDLVDLVGETVKLKKSGRTFTGFCPFHSNTRTPSFVVWPESGTWKCFGACNTGGDAFTYVMKRDGLEFREALELLAARTGVELPRPDAPPAAAEKSDRLREAVAAAAHWFNHLLKHNSKAQTAREHLSQRGISEATIEKFQLGYALDDWNGLRNYLLERTFTVDELVDAGLIVRRDDGSVFDRFRNRLMIPIHDWKGRPIGFGARALSGSDPLAAQRAGEPKYLNSPQTELFDKSKTLYGLHFAKNAIRESGQAVIVEGYMDAIAAHQAGFANVVASLGTALTEMQFKQLQKLARRFILALDADTAGVNAMLRGLDVARESLDREMQPLFNPRGLIGFEGKLQVDIRVLTLPEGADPDDVIRGEPQRWIELIEQARPVVQYVIDTLSAGRDLNDPKEKAAFSREIVAFIRDIADPVERAAYAQRLARLLKVDERAIAEQLGSAPSSTKRPRPRVAAEPGAPARVAIDRERYCLIELLRAPDALQAIDDTLARADLLPFDRDDFESIAHREVFLALQTAVAESIDATRDDVLARLDPALRADLQAWLAAAPARPPIDSSLDETRGIVDAALLLRERNLKTRGAQLEELMRGASEENAAANLRELGQAKLALSDQLRRLSRIRYAPEWIRQSHSSGY